jgi:hypothetical protein
MFLTSSLITRFIDDFTFRMKSQSIVYLMTHDGGNPGYYHNPGVRGL